MTHNENLAQAEWAAGQWMSVALRRMARDTEMVFSIASQLERLPSTVSDVINALADRLESDGIEGRSG